MTMPRTRSSIACSKPHKLPGILTRRGPRAAASSRGWRCLRRSGSVRQPADLGGGAAHNPGSLVIRARAAVSSDAPVAAQTWGPVYGCHALASDVGSYNGDGIGPTPAFQPSRCFFDAEPVLAPPFLTGMS